MTSTVRVSILVKALNEEDKIARCLEAAVREAQVVDGEVILADSLSMDRTVEIARTFPVRIVQFEHAADRSCGAAIQLGYQFARGEFLFVIDGDMELQPGFVSLGLDYLEANPSVAGVGGLILDRQVYTPADKRRAHYYAAVGRPTNVNSLGGGGLYRRGAIESVGYLANRWLNACEEAELGARLESAGWRLVRLPAPAAVHTGHTESGLGMLLRLWRNGRMQAYGVFLRSAMGRPWWLASVRHAWFVFVAPGLYLAGILLSWLLASAGARHLVALAVPIPLLWGSVFLALWRRKRGASEAALAVAAWHLYTVAAFSAMLCKVADPRQPIVAREIGTEAKTR